MKYSADGVVARSECDHSYKERGTVPETDRDTRKWHFFTMTWAAWRDAVREGATPIATWAVVMAGLPWPCHLITRVLWNRFWICFWRSVKSPWRWVELFLKSDRPQWQTNQKKCFLLLFANADWLCDFWQAARPSQSWFLHPQNGAKNSNRLQELLWGLNEPISGKCYLAHGKDSLSVSSYY